MNLRRLTFKCKLILYMIKKFSQSSVKNSWHTHTFILRGIWANAPVQSVYYNYTFKRERGKHPTVKAEYLSIMVISQFSRAYTLTICLACVCVRYLALIRHLSRTRSTTDSFTASLSFCYLICQYTHTAIHGNVSVLC